METTKRLTLKQEGITPDFLKSFSMEQEYSPVQLMPSEEPVKLIRCSAGYWVMLEYGDYLKDEKRRLVVIPEKEAKIGRARYLLAFKEQIAANKGAIYEGKIQEEICRLKAKVDDRVKQDLSKMREILVFAGIVEPEGIEAILINAAKSASGNDPFSLNQSDKSRHELREAKAKELATEDFVNAYECLKCLSEAGDYDNLYIHYFQDGIPLLASFAHANPNDMAALVKNFHRDKLEATLQEINANDHLYLVAKLNVDKKYI